MTRHAFSRTCSIVVIALTLLAVSACQRAEDAPANAAARSTSVVGGLKMITVVTADPAATRDLLAAFNLQAPPDAPTERSSVAAEAQLWGVSEAIAASATVLANATDPQAPRVRVMTVSADEPLVRSDRSARRDGGLSLGFACAPTASDSASAVVPPAGLTPENRVAVVIPRPDGAGEFTVEEAYFAAPENVVVPCITRPADLPPLAPLDPARGVGGPAYAGIVVANIDQEVAFYAAVLGLEQRRDLTLTDAKLLAAVGLPADARLRLVQLFAPGTTSGFLTLLDAGAHGERNVHVRPPARGVALWTFAVRDLLEVRRKLKDAHGVVVAGPVAARSAEWGDYQAMTALTPAGTFLELVEVKGP
jgi:catechol 2,3-dioxygenase-like lactoylglutathione lyase family enzyme